MFVCLLPAPNWLELASRPRRNLQRLVDLTAPDDHRNYQRTFWRWLEKQKWRSMLPQPFMWLGFFISMPLLRFMRGLSPWHSGWTRFCKTQVGKSSTTWTGGVCFCRAMCYLLHIWFLAFVTWSLPCFIFTWGFLRCTTMTGSCLKHASLDLTGYLVLNVTFGEHLVFVMFSWWNWCMSGLCLACRRLNHFGNRWRILIGFGTIQFCHRLIFGLVWFCIFFGLFGASFNC